MWRFYLVLSELAFRHGGHVVFQIQIAKKQDAVPLTRDYLALPEMQDELITNPATSHHLTGDRHCLGQNLAHAVQRQV